VHERTVDNLTLDDTDFISRYMIEGKDACVSCKYAMENYLQLLVHIKF
jgi:hypothetical protein